MRKVLHNKLGVWGELYKKNLEKNNPKVLTTMKKNNTLYTYLENYQKSMEQRAEMILKKLREDRGINQKLFDADPIEFFLQDLEAQVDVRLQLEEEILESR